MFYVLLMVLVASVSLRDVRTVEAAEPAAEDAPVVHNPDQGIEPDVTREPSLAWVVDTEQEEILIGRVADVEIGPDGNVYLLDNQLSQVFVYSPQGEYLRTIGREGEGPGEFRNPMGMFFLDDGTLGVVQLMPGKVAMLDLEGSPVGDLPVPRSADDTPQMLMAGRSAGGYVVLQLSNHGLQGSTVRVQTSLVGVARDGSVRGTYFDHVQEQPVNPTGGGISISIDSSVIGTWAAAADGTVYHAPGRNDYSISVLDAGGRMKYVIERGYLSRERSQSELDALREERARFGGAGRDVDRTDPDIAELLPRPGGWLWVLTSRGLNDRPEGSVGVYDVFDSEGRFQRRLTLTTGFDPDDDVAYFAGDRLFVIENGAGTLSAGGGDMHVVVSRGSPSDEEDDGDPEPMRILCYRLEG